jgi:hypothetical protein
MEYNFTGRKPSNAQVLKKINEGINRGEDLIELYWGENSITLELSKAELCSGMWHGWGWIRNISGADLAVKINSVQHNKTLNLWNT